MHEVWNFGFYADLPPQVMQFMELEPDDRSMCNRKYRGCLKVGGQHLPRDSPTN
jgi:hypothetical protein